MDADQIRKQNLDALLKAYREKCEAEGRKFLFKDFAAEHNISEKNLQHIRTGVRAMGKNVARRIEKKRKLPHGWMDQDHSRNHIGQVPQNHQGYLDLYAQMLIDDPKSAIQVLMETLKRKKK